MKVAVAGLAVAIAVVPRERDTVQVAALAAAALIGLQLVTVHWFYLYVVWFAPFVFVALFAAQRRPEPAVPRMKWVRAGALVLLAATFCLTFLVDPWQDELVSDVPLYRAYADVFLDGALPYRDVGFEYPPLAAPLIALPGLVSLDPETYRYAFAVLTFALAAGVLLATGRLAALGRGREWVALVVVALAPLAAGAMLRTHFDLAPGPLPRRGPGGGRRRAPAHRLLPVRSRRGAQAVPARRRGRGGGVALRARAARPRRSPGSRSPRSWRASRWPPPWRCPPTGRARRSSTTSSARCRSRACRPAC